MENGYENKFISIFIMLHCFRKYLRSNKFWAKTIFIRIYYIVMSPI